MESVRHIKPISASLQYQARSKVAPKTKVYKRSVRLLPSAISGVFQASNFVSVNALAQLTLMILPKKIGRTSDSLELTFSNQMMTAAK